MNYDKDDDAGPPSLSSLADQVQALSSEQTGARRPAIADEDDSSLPIASTTVIGGKAKGELQPCSRLIHAIALSLTPLTLALYRAQQTYPEKGIL